MSSKPPEAKKDSSKPPKPDPMVERFVKTSSSSSGLAAVRMMTSEQAKEQIEQTKEQVGAWREMAEHMVNVVRTIQQNERRQLFVTFANLFCAVITITSVFYLVYRVDQSVLQQSARDQKAIEKLDETTTQTLQAVNAVTRAMALKIETDTDMSPVGDHKAKTAAVEAQQKALEAIASSSRGPEKQAAEKELKAVQKKAKELDVPIIPMDE